MTEQDHSNDQTVSEFELENQKIIAAEADRVREAINTKDDLVYLLLRLHLLSEHVLERIITCNLQRPDRLLDENVLSYNQKLLLVHALDIVPEAGVQAFRHLNALRNRCSHERARHISRDDIDRIGRPLGAEYKEIVKLFAENPEELLSATVVKAYMKFVREAVARERTVRPK